MSEVQPRSHEHGSESLPNNAEAKARQRELLDEAKEKAANSRNEHQEKLNDIRNEIDKSAANAKEMTAAESRADKEPEAASTYWNSQEYRDIAFSQFMGRVRKHLTGPEKTASKILHNPIVEKASEIGGRTIARPSGVLSGSIFSFVVSLTIFFLAKRNGYDMTYSIFIASFLGGFIFGVALEFIYRGIRSLLSRD